MLSELDRIGRTPVQRLDSFAASLGLNAQIYGKLECCNLTGSIKDRIALHIVRVAEIAGLIDKNSTIVEPTSGNTGISLAAVCAMRGYRLVIAMPDSMSAERRRLMSDRGATVTLTPGAKGMRGAVDAARDIAARCANSFIPDQFSNMSNPEAHYLTTGPELLDALGAIDYLVAGVGTGGTISGAGRFMKERLRKIKIIAVEPASSPLLSKGRAGSHSIEGLGANFVPKTLDLSVCDEIIRVSDSDARAYARRLAVFERLFCGPSSGAALKAAEIVARRPEAFGKRIAAILPDSGDRYLSSGLFEGID